MKTLGLLKTAILPLFFVLILFVAGCEKNEDLDSLLVGTWHSTGAEVNITIDDTDYAEYMMNELGYTQQQVDDILETWEEAGPSVLVFRSDGSYTANFTYDDPENGTWKLSSDEKVLTVTTEGDETIIQIYSLTASVLIADMHDESYEDVNDDGSNEQIIYNSRLNFARVEK